MQIMKKNCTCPGKAPHILFYLILLLSRIPKIKQLQKFYVSKAIFLLFTILKDLRKIHEIYKVKYSIEIIFNYCLPYLTIFKIQTVIKMVSLSGCSVSIVAVYGHPSLLR